jgi:hypothetical protein
MSEEGSVEPGESILRRIPRAVDYYNPSLALPILAVSFRPRDDETDGISFYRERFVSVLTLAASGRKPPYIIARMMASDIFALGLSLVPTPGDEGLPGHVVMPELSVLAKRNNKRFVTEKNFQLATLASKDVIV